MLIFFVFQKKNETLTKEKEELNKENQALLKQIEDLKSSTNALVKQIEDFKSSTNDHSASVYCYMYCLLFLIWSNLTAKKTTADSVDQATKEKDTRIQVHIPY